MTSMLREPIEYPSGTAVRARSLAVKYDIAGKTGTTNDFTDAWFLGFSPTITCGVWVGFDDHRTLGDKEEGSHVALPIWMQFMSQALADQPPEKFTDSPVLTSPQVVNQILASTGTASVLAERAGTATPAAAQAATAARTSPPAATAAADTAKPQSPTAAPQP